MRKYESFIIELETLYGIWRIQGVQQIVGCNIYDAHKGIIVSDLTHLTIAQ